MIIGVGIDIVHISRMQRWVGRTELLERFFHPGEIDDARGRGKAMMHSLAARFAAKEAFGKALGTGLRNMRLRDIRVESDCNGKPSMTLYEGALRKLKESGGVRVHVSLTHENDNAVAMVVIEGE